MIKLYNRSNSRTCSHCNYFNQNLIVQVYIYYRMFDIPSYVLNCVDSVTIHIKDNPIALRMIVVKARCILNFSLSWVQLSLNCLRSRLLRISQSVLRYIIIQQPFQIAMTVIVYQLVYFEILRSNVYHNFQLPIFSSLFRIISLIS